MVGRRERGREEGGGRPGLVQPPVATCEWPPASATPQPCYNILPCICLFGALSPIMTDTDARGEISAVSSRPRVVPLLPAWSASATRLGNWAERQRQRCRQYPMSQSSSGQAGEAGGHHHQQLSTGLSRRVCRPQALLTFTLVRTRRPWVMSERMEEGAGLIMSWASSRTSPFNPFHLSA